MHIQRLKSPTTNHLNSPDNTNRSDSHCGGLSTLSPNHKEVFMATRLYPVAYSICSLEILAGVPEGTHARLRALEARHPNRLNSDAAWACWYKARERDLDVSKLDVFLTDGWGRVSKAFIEIVESIGDGMHWATGHVDLLDNPRLCAALLRSKGLDPEKVLLHLRGLSWG
jgi:hypothetical protein